MNILENFNKYYSNLTESTLLNEATLSQVVDQMWAGLAASKTEGELRKRMAQYWAYANNEPPRNKEMLLARLDGLFARAEQELLPHIKAKEIAAKKEKKEKKRKHNRNVNNAPKDALKITNGSNIFYYHTANIKTLNTILDSGKILATKEDSGSGNVDKNFISLGISINNHVQRKDTSWRYGIALDATEVISYCANNDITHVDYNWLLTNPSTIIEAIGEFIRPLVIYDTQAGVKKKVDVDYYYLRFVNCGYMPVTESLYRAVEKELLANFKPISNKWTIPTRYGQNKPTGNSYIFWKHELLNWKNCPKFEDLSDYLQDAIATDSLFNEQEHRIRNISSLPISEALLTLVVDESLKPYLYGGSHANDDLTVADIKRLIDEEDLDLMKTDAEAFLEFRKKSIEHQWEPKLSTYNFYDIK